MTSDWSNCYSHGTKGIITHATNPKYHSKLCYFAQTYHQNSDISAEDLYLYCSFGIVETSLHVHVLHFSSAGDNPDMTDGRYYTWCDCNIFSGNVTGGSTVRQPDCGLEYS